MLVILQRATEVPSGDLFAWDLREGSLQLTSGQLSLSLAFVQGFHPDDFTPGGRGRRQGPGGVHPDMMQPGPGQGTDWDSMFG